jgi:hypothetical protein
MPWKARSVASPRRVTSPGMPKGFLLGRVAFFAVMEPMAFCA